MYRNPTFDKYVRLSLYAVDQKNAGLGEVALFMYDFDTLYELLRMAVDPAYEDYKYSRFSLYRNGRPVDEGDKLRVEKLALESPLEIAAQIPVYAGAASSVLATIWLLVQVVEKISNFPLERKKLRLEIESLEKQLADNPADVPRTAEPDASHLLHRRGADEFVDQVIKRLGRSPVEVIEISIDLRTGHDE